MEAKLVDSGNLGSFYKYVNRKLNGSNGIAPLRDKKENLVTANSEKAELLNNYVCNGFTTDNEFIWCATSRRQHRLPTSAVMFGSDGVQPSSSVSESGRLHRLRPRDADPCRANGFKVLRGSTSTTQHPQVCADVSLPVTGGYAGAEPARLRKCDSNRASRLLTSPSGVGSECVCKIDIWTSSCRPHH